VELAAAEIEDRRAAYVPEQRPPLGGLLEKYAATVGSAHLGAVTHSGAVHWERDR
jgi:dihydroxy-acid dehydratase